MTEIEMIDELTNCVMDIMRDEFKLNHDTDKDDRIYTDVHNAIGETYKEITK